MTLILAIILEMLFIFLIIFTYYKVMISKPLDISKDSLGRNHRGIVTFSSSGYDIHFDERTNDEMYN